MEWLRTIEKIEPSAKIVDSYNTVIPAGQYEPSRVVCKRNAWSVVASKRISMWESMFHVPYGAGVNTLDKRSCGMDQP